LNRQAFEIAFGQKLQGQGANFETYGGHFVIGLIFQNGFELNPQALTQIACANAHGLQGLQQAQGHREAVHQLFQLLDVVGACQALRQRLEAVFQIAIVVQGLDEEAQGRTVNVGQAHRQCLTVQILGE